MATDKSKTGRLSAQLDFEDVSNGTINPDDIDLSHLDFHLDPALTSLESLVQPPLDHKEAVNQDEWAAFPEAKPASPVVAATRTVSKTASKAGKPKKEEKNDRFALYAAGIALLSFIIIFASLFYFKVLGNDENQPSYLSLPQTVTNLHGETIRIQVTLQVGQQDKDWLNSHKKALAELFPIVITKINPEDLHSEQGFDHVREQLRQELNQGTGSDKIQSVLINELLTQSRPADDNE